jgi:transcriptional regulator with XRE-family HTH domain
MDDAPYTGDLDLSAVKTRDDLALLLRMVHARADKPSLRALEAKTRHSATPLSKTVAAEMLKGVRFPRKAVMVAFLLACGIADSEVESWRRTWERIAASDGVSAGSKVAQTTAGRQQDIATTGRHPLFTMGDSAQGQLSAVNDSKPVSEFSTAAEMKDVTNLREQIGWLNLENEQLRSQLLAVRQQAAGSLSSEGDASNRSAHSPVISRRQLGTLLRALRLEKGMTVEYVAEQLMCSAAKVKRMESGFRSGTVRDVRDLCNLYGITEASRRDHMLELARAGKQQSWWQFYGLKLSTYVELEMEATAIRNYESAVVPGLAQTEDYARAIIGSWVEFTPEVVEQRVEGRLIRQYQLTKTDAPRVWFILDEAALHRVVGGPTVMVAQLERLIEIAGLPHVTIQVVPYEIGAHPAVGGNFAILDFARPATSVVYAEGPVGDLCLERARDVEQYRLVFERLRSVAWGERESIGRIADIKKIVEDGL